MSAESWNVLLASIQKTTGLSLAAIAEKIGVAPTTLRDWRKRGVPKDREVRVLNNIRLKFREVI
jgi:uncharacterized protein YjcR